MNFRAIVQDGLIVVNTRGTLPDGTTVRISVEKQGKSAGTRSAKRKAKATKPSSTSRRVDHLPGFGMWADRDELGDAQSAVKRLRALTRRHRVG